MKKGTSVFKYFTHWFNAVWRAISPGPRAWKGATLGLLAATVLIWLIFSYSIFAAQPRVVSTLIGTVVALLLAAMISGVLLLLGALLKVAPMSYRWVLFGALVLLSSSFILATPIGALVTALAVIMVSSLLGAAVGVLASGGLKDTTVVQRIITIVGLLFGAGGLVFGTVWLMGDGPTVESPLNAAAQTSVETLDMPDPSLPGEFAVQTLFYGSGNDLHRPEYADGVDLMTETVDGSPFIDGWEQIVGWSRTSYWGFEPDELPLNGRVWYPAGEGPFPLVLVVHGNHAMEDFSDEGYDYLGQLLASRGVIVASIDENFLNLSWADILGGLEEENDARGWLLLEHLRLWREWNKIPDHPFYQKMDMDRIALIGHSRGGEAVAIATAFNTLPNYPDDATITFDYGFNIRSVVAIAPVDGQYMPTGRGTPLENVDYLVLHGVNDGDVRSFSGLAQYERVKFTDGRYRFKAALYILGANHGQFNTTWGRSDIPQPAAKLLNLSPLMSTSEQEQIAKVYISAFLEATVQGQSDYIPLFRDYRVATDWLPDTIYLNQFEDSSYQFVSTFEEDINVATTTITEGTQAGQNLTVWREQVVETKWGPKDTSAVYLGWDALATEAVASYTITLPDQGLALDAESVLIFSMADANEESNPNAEDEEEVPVETEEGPREPIDLTIEVIDGAGVAAHLPLSSFSLLQPQIKAQLFKAEFMDLAGPSEAVLQSFAFPLADFTSANPEFDPARLTTIRFIFDRTPAGVVILDEIGFRESSLTDSSN